MVNRPLFPLALIAIALVLTSCGRADVKNSSSQIIAKVNGEEISVQQINDMITRRGHLGPEHSGQTAAQILEQIIDHELLVQRALQAKLDRDPQVLQAIRGARRQILAQAYVERAVISGPGESQEEIRKFYKENPALFERRRIYRFHELVVAAPQEKLGALKGATSRAKTLGDVAEWLEIQKLPFSVATSRRPAEQIPMDILPRLFEMRDGQFAVFPRSRGASVVQLLQTEEAPVSELQATPVVERYLLSHKRLEVTRAEIRKLREKAKIEYVDKREAMRPPAPLRPVLSSATRGGGAKEDVNVKSGIAALR